MAIRDFGEIAEKLRRSTVLVLPGERGNGSGVIWSADGVIITNAHVARASQMRIQLWDGREFDATLVSRDTRRDLAELRCLIRDPRERTHGRRRGLSRRRTRASEEPISPMPINATRSNNVSLIASCRRRCGPRCQEILLTGQFVVPAKAGTQEQVTEIPGYPLSRE